MDQRLARAMRTRPTCTVALPWLAVRVRLQLVRAYADIADVASAQHRLREIDDIAVRRPQLGTLVDQVSEVRAALLVKPRQGASGGPLLTPAELRLVLYLQTHLTFREIGDRLFVSRNTVNTEVGSIYRKLGVSSRNEAVQRAMAIGMLGAWSRRPRHGLGPGSSGHTVTCRLVRAGRSTEAHVHDMDR